jgi:hypothetical protein
MSTPEQDLPNPNPSGQDISPQQSVPIDAASLASHYELDDIDTRSIFRFGGLLLVVLIIVQVVVYWFLREWTDRPLPIQVQIPPALVTPPVVPGPGLDASPEANLDAYLAGQMELLNSYGWVDPATGIVHIPIERAMSLLVERGVPARDGEAPDFGLAPAFRMDSTGGVKPVGEGEREGEESEQDQDTEEGAGAGEDEGADD